MKVVRALTESMISLLGCIAIILTSIITLAVGVIVLAEVVSVIPTFFFSLVLGFTVIHMLKCRCT